MEKGESLFIFCRLRVPFIIISTGTICDISQLSLGTVRVSVVPDLPPPLELSTAQAKK
jgi:hypothetical protein